MEARQKRGLSGNSLKVIAILAMTVDHIGWAFVTTMSPLGQVMHVVGRLTAPIMCFSIAEGYAHTRSVPKYALRLVAFAVIAQVPYSLLTTMGPFSLNMNVIYTLCLGLLAIHAYHETENPVLRWSVIAVVAILASVGDWSYFGVIFCLIFYCNRGRPIARNLYMIVTAMGIVAIFVLSDMARGVRPSYAILRNLMQLGIVLSLPLIGCYNGQRGKPLPGGRWFFYLYYPAHMLAIYFAKLMLK